jgi:hypothetical protein
MFMLGMVNYIYTQKLSTQKKANNSIDPIPKFSFLIPGNAITVSQTIRIEQFDILIGMDITELAWKQKYELMKLLVENFPKLAFFSDETLKKEFLSLCKVGENIFTQFHELVTEAFKYKNEEVTDLAVNICSETPLQIKGEELDNEYNKLYARLQLIKGDWTIADIKASPDKQTILFEYCSYFNDFAIIYGQKAGAIVTALEQLSDGHFPEVLLGNLIRTCTTASNGNGENFEVIQCGGTDKGFRCQIMSKQATNLKEYDTMIPVHYQGVGMIGENKDNMIIKTIDLKEYKYLECEKEYTDFHVCREIEIPMWCKNALETDDIGLTIKNCNFSKIVPPVLTQIPNGGVLIQGDNTIKVMNGVDRVTAKLPIAIYSPNTLKIEAYEEEYLVTPSVLVDKTIIIDSKLKEEEIALLISTENWNEIFDEAEVENYIDIALIILQIILIPVVLVGFCLTLRQGKVLKNFGRNKLRRQNTSDNLRNNQQYLLKRIKK